MQTKRAVLHCVASASLYLPNRYRRYRYDGGGLQSCCHVNRERPSGVPTEAGERGSGSEIGDFAKNSHLYAPVTAAKQLRTAGCHQTTANRHRLSWTAANCR